MGMPTIDGGANVVEIPGREQKERPELETPKPKHDSPQHPATGK
jgi:hypothetical protein